MKDRTHHKVTETPPAHIVVVHVHRHHRIHVLVPVVVVVIIVVVIVIVIVVVAINDHVHDELSGQDGRAHDSHDVHAVARSCAFPAHPFRPAGCHDDHSGVCLHPTRRGVR